MAEVIILRDGGKEVISEAHDFLELVDTHLGNEARVWLEEFLSEGSDREAYITDLEGEARGLRNHHRAVMDELRGASEKIAKLIREKEIDRKALSAAAGQIGTVTWRELSV